MATTIDEIAELARQNLTLLHELTAHYGVGRQSPRSGEPCSFMRPQDIFSYLSPEMSDLEQEQLRVVLLDNKNVITGSFLIYQGSTCATLVRIAEIFREAVRMNAMSIVVVHNHPSGDPTPSPEDYRVTEEIKRAGKILDIELLDHVVIGRGRWISLRQQKGSSW